MVSIAKSLLHFRAFISISSLDNVEESDNRCDDKRTSELNLQLFAASSAKSRAFVQLVEGKETQSVDRVGESSAAAMVYNNNYGAGSIEAEAMLKSIMRVYHRAAAVERRSSRQLSRSRAKSAHRNRGSKASLLYVTDLSAAIASIWSQQIRLQGSPRLTVKQQRRFMQDFYKWVLTQPRGHMVSAEAFYDWFRSRYTKGEQNNGFLDFVLLMLR